MKKQLLTIVCLVFAFTTFAQESTKKVQAGIIYQTGLNFNKPGTKNLTRLGVGAINTIGLNANFSFTDNIGLTTGLEFDFESFKYSMANNNPTYYDYRDTDIIRKDADHSGTSKFQLVDRKYKTTYVTVPTMLIFRTNPIGDFRYFGKFGARTSFLVKNKVDDEGFTVGNVTDYTSYVAANNSGMSSPRDVFFIRSTIGICAGAEWNFTGSTALFAEAGFYYGLTPMHYGSSNEDKNSLYTSGANNGTGNDAYFATKATQKQIVLKIGILF